MQQSNDRLMQNLTDAGCDGKTAQEILSLLRADEPSTAMLLLRRYRQALLDEKHRNEQRIDCLDYLLHQLKKQTPTNRRNG